jgi:hypothetical protein
MAGKKTLSNKSIAEQASEKGCFDLQFRRDVKRKRSSSPVYYAWKAQFVIIGNYQDEDSLRNIRDSLDCGRLHFVGPDKIRYSVQDIDSLGQKVASFFRENALTGKKKNDFELWSRAVEIICRNKGKEIKNWRKKDFLEMMKIQKMMQKYKTKKIREQKWLAEAETIAAILP